MLDGTVALKGKTAMKIRMQWKTYNWRTIQEACKAKKQFLVCCQCSRGVARLDGARGKKQLWRPHVRTWALSGANLLHWRKHLWYCWDFRRPPQWFSAWGIVSPFPSLRPCSAVRDSGVDLHDTRVVTRLDGVRGKNQIWRSHIWTWSLMEANCIEGSICDIVGNFRRPPQSFGAPIVISVSGELLSPCTRSFRPWMVW